MTVRRGHLACLALVCDNGFPFYDRGHCTAIAAESGHFHCLQYLREHGASWTSETTVLAAFAGSLQCFPTPMNTAVSGTWTHGRWPSATVIWNASPTRTNMVQSGWLMCAIVPAKETISTACSTHIHTAANGMSPPRQLHPVVVLPAYDTHTSMVVNGTKRRAVERRRWVI